MTPTLDRASARVARPRLLELSRQVAVDFQPDADFDERRRCPGHGLLPFMDQYRSRSSPYPGSRWIQEIKIIAFFYGPALQSPATDRPAPPRSLCRMPFPVTTPPGSRRCSSVDRSGPPHPSWESSHPLSPKRPDPSIMPVNCPTPASLIGCLRKEHHAAFTFREGHPQFPVGLAMLRRRPNAISTRTHLPLDRRF
jgi:hypothetical protein